MQEWSGTMNPLDSPRALSSEGLPQFSLSPLPYITEVSSGNLSLIDMYNNIGSGAVI